MNYIVKNLRCLVVLMAVIFTSCQSIEEQAPAQDAAGANINEVVEIPTIVTTIWTDKTELFVEYPSLIVGKTSRFAAHFTILDKHQPVREGSVTVSLIKGGKGIRHTVGKPLRAGIFSPSLQPKESGIYQLVFDIKTPTYHDGIVIGDVRVFATTEEAINNLGSEDEASGAISFLKEQAWKIEFQTSRVIQGEIYEVINTSGVWKAAPGAFKSLTASTSGVIGFTTNNLTEGTTVKQGQHLITISSKELTSNNLQAEIEKARANYEQTEAEYSRKRQLYESKIVPKSEFELVENRYRVAKSTYETLNAGYSDGGKQIRAPFDGFIKSIAVNNGDYVDQGAALVTIGTHKSRLLETQVGPSYASALQTIYDIWYQPKSGEWSSINGSGGFILSVGKEVKRDKPLIPIYALVNEPVEMPEGSYTEVQIAIGNARKNPLIPEAALLEDYGSYSVIVQLSGESFERRTVTIGRRNGKNVEVLDGLKADEIVVTKGAYQVKMASMSGLTPAHGHEH